MTSTQRERLQHLSYEQKLVTRCVDYARNGRLQFWEPGTIRLRRREFKARLDSRLFRSAVEALSRVHSCLVSIKQARAGKPFDAVLFCPNCHRNSRRLGWLTEADFPRFSLEEWPYDGDRSRAFGSCTGCQASTVLHRDSYSGTWRAVIRDQKNDD
jgi:hypothetical protein